MSKLLIYIGENEKFDVKSTSSVISSLEGVSNVRIGNFIGAIFECEYERNGKSTIVRISPEAETVTAEGLDDVALEFAIELQKHTLVELHAIDMDYSFDVALRKFGTVSDFRNEIGFRSE